MAKGVIGLGVIAAIAAVVVPPHPASDSRPALGVPAPGEGATPRPVFVRRQDLSANLVYGMTEQQVQRRTGKPTKKLFDRTAGLNCWQYTLHHTIGDHTLNAVRICFVEDRYSVQYSEVDGKWVYVLPKIGSR